MLTQDYLKQELKYCVETGLFYRKYNNSNDYTIAGNKDDRGYTHVSIGGKNYLAHRLAWFYMYGEWPDGNLDHVNQVKDDNRISNLRVANQQTNMKNLPKNQFNTSGFNGVSWSKNANKWHAHIGVNGKRKNLGMYSIFEDAVKARQDANIKYGYHENHGKQGIKLLHNERYTRERYRAEKVSKYKGVTWHKNNLKWNAIIRVGGHIIYLGMFDKEQDAIMSRLVGEERYLHSPDAKKNLQTYLEKKKSRTPYITYVKNEWAVQLRLKGVVLHIGFFDSKEAAIIARDTALNNLDKLSEDEKIFLSENKCLYLNEHYGLRERPVNRGVTFNKRFKKWRAFINVNKKNISLGYYENKDDAIKVRIAYEKKIVSSLIENKKIKKIKV